MTAWTDLVKKIWNENKNKDGFKFKDALVKAKSIYKSMPKNKTIKNLKSKIKGKKGGKTEEKIGGDDTEKVVKSMEDSLIRVNKSMIKGVEDVSNTVSKNLPFSGGKSRRRTKKDKKDDKKEEEEKKGGNVDPTNPIKITGKTPHF